MSKKKAILLSITILFIGLIITAGSYAFWSWSSNTNKNIVFNTAKELRNYVIYDEGESKFVGDFKVSTSYTDGIHSTISLYKTSEATNVDLIATIYMDINSIGNAMKESTALKWKVTQGDSTNPGTTLAEGNFIGINNGTTMTLVPNIEVTTTLTKYTVWIWIDANDNPSDDMTGETFDSDIWTEINQTEATDFIYQVTRTSTNYQTISATVVNNKNKIVKYAVTTTNIEPAANSTDWVSIAQNQQSNTYNLNTTVNNIGTYYIWFMDEEDEVINAEIEVEEVDSTNPICTFGTWNKQSIANNETAKITLTCTNSGSNITNHNLTTSDLTLSNDYVTLTNISKTSITNGYSYEITVTGTSTDGSTTVTLPANKIKNAMHYGNVSATSTAITIQNDTQAPVIMLDSQSSNEYANAYDVVVSITDDITGIASGASIKYGWSTSNSVEPSTFETVTLDYNDGDLSTTFIATGSGLDGNYYLWIVPVVLADKKGNTNTTSVVSTGTFKFDNDTITAPTISFESNAVTDGLLFAFDGRNNTGNGHDSSATTWNNYGSLSTNGIINGATWQDNYLSFDGVDDYVVTGYRTDSYYTLEALVSMNSYEANGENIFVANYQSGGIGITAVYGKLRVQARIGGTYHYAETSWLADVDRVYSVSGTYDGTALKLYIDGVLIASDSVSGTVDAPSNNTVFALGCNPSGSTCDSAPYLDGKIYAARIYNRALTEAEIKQNYKMDKMALGEYVNGSSNFSVSGGSSLKGISGYQYSLNDSAWNTYNSSSKPTITAEGENEIAARTLNIHSTTSAAAFAEVYVDNTAPTASLDISVVSNSLLATVTAVDELSGVRSIYGYKVSTNSICDSTTTGFISIASNIYNFTINSAGEHYICVRVEDNAGNYGYVSKKTPSTYYPFTGESQTFTAIESGYYKMETWGAQGGNGGNGGYSSGYIYLNENDNLYIYVGSTGQTKNNANNAGGYNGGGAGGTYNGSYGYGGGGATDIRTTNGSWNDITSLNSRIMVAGGGGGGASNTNYTYSYGGGGALIGGNGSGSFTSATTIDPTGGTQTSGGKYGRSGYSDGDGSFGFATQTNLTVGWGGGGGGGYYGGGTGYGRAGAGGSSFISGYAGVNAITAANDRTSTDNTLHYSNKYFINGNMIAGNNSGDGKARITYIGSVLERVNTNLNNVQYVKDCISGSNIDTDDLWTEIQAIKDGVNIAKGKTITGTVNAAYEGLSYNNAVDGKIDNTTTTSGFGLADGGGSQCVTVNLGSVYNLDEIAVWHYYEDGRTFNNNVTYVSSDNSTWTEVIKNNDSETSVGKRVSAYKEYANVTYYANKFGSINQTLNGVTVNYDDQTSELTLNGTWNSTSFYNFSILNNQTFNIGDRYILKLTYVSGSYSYTDNARPSFVMDLVTDGQWFSDRMTEPISAAAAIYPQTGINSTYLEIAPSRASANGLQFWMWQDVANSTTFDNYKVKVEVYKDDGKILQVGDSYKLPSNPSRYGQTFSGWYTSLDGGTEITNSSIINTSGEQTIYALWDNTVQLDFTYTGKYKICYGSEYSTCLTKTNAQTTIASTPWKIDFLTSGTFKIMAGQPSVNIFLVGGGGGGGCGWNNPTIYYSRGGGGGAGGYRTTINSTLALNTNYTITIGGGGAAGKNSFEADGSAGGQTSIKQGTTVIGTANGGGGGLAGAHNSDSTRATGGSAGGTGIQFFNDGIISGNPTRNGNVGAYAFGISTVDGVRYGAGGGGGGGTNAYGTGGTTGGGVGGHTGVGTAGTANTGSGGGGGGIKYCTACAVLNTAQNGGAGGSGIVIIKNNS